MLNVLLSLAVSSQAPVGTLTDWNVSVANRALLVHTARVNLDHENWGWDMKGSPAGAVWYEGTGAKTFRLRPMAKVGAVRLLPHSAGTIRREGNDVLVELTGPRDVIVEPIQTNEAPPLHLFYAAEVLEPKLPEGAFRFGPGVHAPGAIKLTPERKTVYLAPGAFVKGWIEADGVDGVRIFGTGVLDGRHTERDRDSHNLIRLVACRNVQIEGVTLLDNPTWNVVLAACENVMARRVRILAGRPTSDGFDVIQSRRVTIEDCFVRNFDDAVSVKGIEEFKLGLQPAQDVTVRGGTYHCDNGWGSPFAVGYETYAEAIERFTVEKAEITYCRMLLRVLVADPGPVRDVVMRDLTVRMPDPREPLRFTVGRDNYTQWYKNDREASGHIRGVLFQRLKIEGPEWPESQLSGTSAERGIRGVRFESVTLGGRPLTAARANLKLNAHVQPVEFR
ncbi:MAG: glycosyl hydrolase family 28 protein [Fimbriimonadaceae bacterium]|nr:glycosyl hydrolase family 28 protein [Fimbriimonadaceae bacterium]